MNMGNNLVDGWGDESRSHDSSDCVQHKTGDAGDVWVHEYPPEVAHDFEQKTRDNGRRVERRVVAHTVIKVDGDEDHKRAEE